MIQIRTNLPEFKSKLNQISLDLQKRVVRQGAYAAGGVIRDLARQKAPVRTGPKYVPRTKQPIPPGLLKRSISIFSRRSSRGTLAVMVVPKSGRRAVRGKGSSYLRDAYYWAWVEGGHIARGPGQKIKGGERVRRLTRARLRSSGAVVPPHPYLAPAFQQGKTRAVDAFFKQLEKAFLRYR